MITLVSFERMHSIGDADPVTQLFTVGVPTSLVPADFLSRLVIAAGEYNSKARANHSTVRVALKLISVSEVGHLSAADLRGLNVIMHQPALGYDRYLIPQVEPQINLSYAT